MYQGAPYIASQGTMKGRIRSISRHMEGLESYESDPSQVKLQNVLDYAHILILYATIEGISTYVRGYRGKGRVYHFSNVLGMVNDTSKENNWSIGANESAAGQGKAIQCVIHLVW